MLHSCNSRTSELKVEETEVQNPRLSSKLRIRLATGDFASNNTRVVNETSKLTHCGIYSSWGSEGKARKLAGLRTVSKYTVKF